MKKMITRVLSLALAVALVLTLAPAAFAADEPATSGTFGDNITWRFDADTGTLTIEGAGAMNAQSIMCYPWSRLHDDVKRITICKGITSVGPYAFYFFTNAEALDLPDGLKIIGDSAFDICTSLPGITIPGSVELIDADAFSSCTAMEYVHILRGSTTIGKGAFYQCRSLKIAVIEEGVTALTEEIFRDCPSLTTLYLPHSLTEIGEAAFFDSWAIQNIYFDGTEADIQNIQINTWNNDSLSNAIWYPIGLPFSDTPRNWSYKSIQALWLDGIVTGYEDNTFRPNNNITRAEFVTLLAGIARNCGVEVGDSKTASGKFSDVTSGKWYVPVVEWAASTGIVAGHTDGTFCPDNSITRQEMAAIIARFADAYGVPLDAVKDPVAFTDAGSISSYARDAVAAMQVAGIINGYRESDGSYTFRPLNSATRAEAAVMLCGLYMAIPVE